MMVEIDRADICNMLSGAEPSCGKKLVLSESENEVELIEEAL